MNEITIKVKDKEDKKLSVILSEILDCVRSGEFVLLMCDISEVSDE